MLAPSAKRREVFGESHEGCAASYKEPLVRRTLLHMDDSVELIDLFSGVVSSSVLLNCLVGEGAVNLRDFCGFRVFQTCRDKQRVP